MAKTTRTVTVHSARFVEALGLVAHAASQRYERPVLNTIVVDADDKGVRLIAADNYRIAIADVSDEASDFGRAMIWLRDIPLVKSILRAHRGSAELSVDDTSARLTVAAGPLSLTVKLCEGQYPDINHPNLKWGRDGRRQIAVNPQYLSEVTRALAKQTAAIRVYAGETPETSILVTADDFREVIMPLRMAGEDRMLAEEQAA